MKTYSDYHLSDMNKPIFEKKLWSEIYGLLPAGVRIVNHSIKHLDEAERVYQYFHNREGSPIVVLEDKI